MSTSATNSSVDAKVITAASNGLTLDELRELAEFLNHQRPDVKEQAFQILTSLSARDEDISVLASLNCFAKPLIRSLNDKSAKIVTSALTVLVNISTDESMRSQLIKAGVINALMEYLIPNIARNGRLPLLVLNNVTIDGDGCIDMMQEGKLYEGLHMTRLIRWFCDPDMFNPKSDDVGLIANVITNVSQMASFRKLLVNTDRGLLLELREQLNSPSEPRRLGVARAIHNLSNDVDKLGYLLDPKHKIFSTLLLRLVQYNEDGNIDSEEQAKMDSIIVNALADPAQRRDSSKEIRRVVLDTIHNLARQSSSRTFMRGTGVYPLLRELHNYEREIENDEVDELLNEELIVRTLLFTVSFFCHSLFLVV